MADVRRGLDMNRARPVDLEGLTYWSVGRTAPRVPEGPAAHLLPIYDEYLVAYRDRVLVPHGDHVVMRSTGAAVTFQHALVVHGHVAGTWRARPSVPALCVDVYPTRALSRVEQSAVRYAATRYQRFLDEPTTVTIT